MLKYLFNKNNVKCLNIKCANIEAYITCFPFCFIDCVTQEEKCIVIYLFEEMSFFNTSLDIMKKIIVTDPFLRVNYTFN